MHNWARNLLNRIRTKYWRLVFAEFGKFSRVYGRVTVVRPQNIMIGKHTTLNEGIHLNARVKIVIGSYVRISSGCALHTGGLDYQQPIERRGHDDQPITIEDGVWLGANVVVNPGVTIGRGSVVGAGAVVTSNIPPDSLAVGVPAKVVKKIEYKS